MPSLMKSRPWVALAWVFLLAACAQPTAAPHAAIAEQTPAKFLRQAVAPGLYELAYSASQHAVFVASAGRVGEGGETSPSAVLRLDPDTLAVQARIPLPAKGFGVVLDDAAKRLYVGHANDAAITVIDTASHRVIGTVPLAEKVPTQDPAGNTVNSYPHNFREMALDAANHRLYAPGHAFEGSALYVVDTRTLAVDKVVPGLGFVATGVALDAHGGRVLASNLQGQLFAVDTATLAMSRMDGAGDQLLNLAVDPDGGRVFATDQGHPEIDAMRKGLGKLAYYTPRGGGNRVVVMNVADGHLLASLPTGQGPVALLLDATRQRLGLARNLDDLAGQDPEVTAHFVPRHDY
ncbi:MAG: YncE family protein, partial [Comamonadaceae bacterium]